RHRQDQCAYQGDELCLDDPEEVGKAEDIHLQIQVVDEGCDERLAIVVGNGRLVAVVGDLGGAEHQILGIHVADLRMGAAADLGDGEGIHQNGAIDDRCVVNGGEIGDIAD